MATEETSIKSPPYTSYGTFANFIKGLKETGVPSRIDKSVLSKMSGSGQAALLAALQWLGLVNDVGVPTPKLEELISADAAQYSKILASIMVERYPFLTDGTLDISKATGSQVEQKFRDFKIRGSTVVKSVAFFIAAANAAKISLGPHVKAPKSTPSTNGIKRQSRKPTNTTKPETQIGEDEDGTLGEKLGFVKITIPLHGMEDGIVYLPDNLSPTQWSHALKITTFILANYRSDAPAAQHGEKPS